ncbi:MAG: DUF2723 domain-containing protein, partial [Verrucomicrobia bacterium]|nr:DUF2723 domain-containing protein [Cytophagales bacterium]
MFTFKKINNITGWSVFGIAALTYMLTVEPTASFWDCGEFIAASYKLQVPHPPGAPFFLLINRLFSMLSFGDVTKVAYWVNVSSALASAFTSLFLFWTITLLGRRVLKITSDVVSVPQTILLMGAGTVGALAYTFCDSAWWSAVEAEVYAMSSFFTAFVVWAMFKWELIEDEAASNRWLIFIAYTIGLTIGVHLLNLVTLPALALIYYFKKYKITPLGIGAALLAGFVLIFVVQNAIIPGLPSFAQSLEILFVNDLGLPFYSGIIFFLLVFFGALVFGLIYTQRKQLVLANTGLLALSFILIGYASYTQVLIRSNFNTPINENNPSDNIKFVSYLKREQYGDRPLLYGPNFTSQLLDQKQGEGLYRKDNKTGKYEIYDYRIENIFDPNKVEDPEQREQIKRVLRERGNPKNGLTLFPRLFSKADNHPQIYRQRLNFGAKENPSFGHNVKWFFERQLGYMYFRYFLWNFGGRESDIEGATYLRPWEVSTKGLPHELQNNKGRNQYFWLPLFLVILGLIFLFGKDRQAFAIVGLLYIFTGIALVVFLNSPPVEPRERDYIYV